MKRQNSIFGLKFDIKQKQIASNIKFSCRFNFTLHFMSEYFNCAIFV